MFGYDLKQAFTYFLQDEHKILKLFVLYVMTAFVGIMNIAVNFIDKIDSISAKYILLALLLYVIAGFYYSGYMAVNLNSRILKPENKLPRLWDCLKYIAAGFKLTVGIFLYQLLFSVLIGLSILFIALAAGLMSTNLPVGVVLMTFAVIILIAIILYLLLYIIGVSIAFCINLKFDSMFNSKLLKNILSKNFKSILKVLLIACLFGIAGIVISVLLSLTVVGIVLIPVVWLILFLTIADIYAQLVRKIFDMETPIK